MPENSTSTPLWTPFVKLLHSRAFLLMIAAALVDALILAVPSLEPLRGDFMNWLNALVGLIIVKLGGEDIAKTLGAAKVEAEVVRAEAQGTAFAHAIAASVDDEHDGDTKPLAPTVYPPPSRFS